MPLARSRGNHCPLNGLCALASWKEGTFILEQFILFAEKIIILYMSICFFPQVFSNQAKSGSGFKKLEIIY